MASTNQDNKSNNIDIQKMVEFVKKNARYFVAGALFVVLLLILVKFTGNGIGNADDNNVAVTETVVTEEAYEENAVPAVNELINSYFTAYASGDLVTLQTLATPITQNEQSYITLISQYIEQYQDINCYTKSGLDSNSYMVNVSLNVKFMGVETPAPGLYFFYVRTNDDGSLYIDNLYSEYNLSRQEINMKPYKDPDEFIKALGAEAYQERIDQAENSFLFEVRMEEQQHDMHDPEGKTAFYNAVAKMLCGFTEKHSIMHSVIAFGIVVAQRFNRFSSVDNAASYFCWISFCNSMTSSLL